MADELSQQEAESIVVRIKKLMALSKSSNENEAAAAAAKAQELLIKYNVEAAAIDNVSLDKKDTQLQQEFIDLFGADAVNVIQWKRSLAFGVATANLCKGISSGKGMWFLGKKHNIEIAQFMYETIAQDVVYIADKKWDQILALRSLDAAYPEANLFTDLRLKTVHGKTWKASFYVGAVETIKNRLVENLTSLKLESGPTMALVTTEKEAVDRFANEIFPKIYAVKGMSASYKTAYLSGKNAGHEIQFKRGVGAGGVHGGPALLGKGEG